jgi:hypothetical protein
MAAECSRRAADEHEHRSDRGSGSDQRGTPIEPAARGDGRQGARPFPPSVSVMKRYAGVGFG